MPYAKQKVSKLHNAESELRERMPLTEHLIVIGLKGADFPCEGRRLPNGSVAGRLRAQAHLSSSGLSVICGGLDDEIANLDQLGFGGTTVRALRKFLCKRQGMGSVTRRTGSGNSTTLAPIIDWLRCNHSRYTVTVEDPIEYRYAYDLPSSQNAVEGGAAARVVTQQEVGKHGQGYCKQLKDVVRTALQVTLIGEAHDSLTVEVGTEVAQSGDILITTLHTNSADKWRNRMNDEDEGASLFHPGAIV